MSVPVELRFPHHFHCEVLDELPGSPFPRRHFFPGGPAGGRDGPLLRVISDGGADWIGTFAFGHHGPTRVIGMPDPDRLCVVARGAGYVVSASRPEDWEPVRAVPITDVRGVPESHLVVFANYTDVIAYGDRGLRWRTDRLALDELRITTVLDGKLFGDYYAGDERRRFEVDLATGAARELCE